MERGARIVIQKWIQVRPWDKVLIVTTKEHIDEAQVLRQCAQEKARLVFTLVVEETGRHVGVFSISMRRYSTHILRLLRQQTILL